MHDDDTVVLKVKAPPPRGTVSEQQALDVHGASITYDAATGPIDDAELQLARRRRQSSTNYSGRGTIRADQVAPVTASVTVSVTAAGQV